MRIEVDLRLRERPHHPGLTVRGLPRELLGPQALVKTRQWSPAAGRTGCRGGTTTSAEMRTISDMEPPLCAAQLRCKAPVFKSPIYRL